MFLYSCIVQFKASFHIPLSILKVISERIWRGKKQQSSFSVVFENIVSIQGIK